MATKKTKKNHKKCGNAIEFYVVSWAEYNHDSKCMDMGTFSEIYSTLKKARGAVFDCLKDTAQDCLDRYDKYCCKDVFGTNDVDELVQRIIVINKPFTITAVDDDSDIMYEYVITKYSTKYII